METTKPRDNLTKDRKYMETMYLDKGLKNQIYKKLKSIATESKKIGKGFEIDISPRRYTVVSDFSGQHHKL